MNEERKEQIRYFGFAGVVGVLLLLNLAGVWKTVFGLDTAAILTVLAGYRIFFNSIRALLNKEISADLAICIAVIAALTVGEYLAAAEAMFIMLLGEGLEGYAAGRTSAAIERFVEQMPRRARRLRNGEEEEVDAAALEPDDQFVVRAGERIAADGVVAEGASAVDEATITGEPVPRDKEPGDEVFAGTLNGNGRLVIRVTKAGEETTLARVVALVEEARERQAPVVRLADQYAKYFLPALLLAGGLTWWYTRDWLRTVAVLLVACPCALILATPTAMVAAIGGLARRGILVRGGTVLQQAAACDTVVFDKTGTVTEGRFEVQRIIALGGREDEVLRAAAAAESGSTHPLARVIVDEAERRGWREPSTDSVVVPGRGAQARVNGSLVRSGNRAFLEAAGIAGASPLIEEADRSGATAVLVARDETLLGAVLLRDRLREGIQPAVAELTALGFASAILLTGDRRRPAEVIAREAGIPNVEAELLPQDKLDRVRSLMSQGRKVAMIGDGVNDAPALAAAHTGIAVSGASDITAEAADVVYMGHSLEKLPKLFDVSRRAVRTAWQNIILFAGVVNVLAVAAAATGTIGPLGAAFTHQLSSFFVMLNSLRLLRVEGRESRLRRWARGWWERLKLRWPVWSWREHAARLWNARERWWRPALATLAAVIVLSGITIIQPEELGVIERFGRKQLPYWQPGLHYKLPWPV
ncbi:MAG: heavy metal translocating P-type ATPase, partial [Bryobacter sp.]|nr:heavy metal translocating P-type ATPase [Bryobacter sp.]